MVVRKRSTEQQVIHTASTARTLLSFAATLICCDSYLLPASLQHRHHGQQLVFHRFGGGAVTPRVSMIYAPPGSGYATPEDEKSELPDSYEPMMEFPGTMRPGRTPENQPFHDLPIGDNDPDPIPWPHFQQIEWHHRWEPPHPHPIPMEEFIEMNGRWATPEMEAAMRAGVRRDVKQRKEKAEAEKRETLIVDDEDEDEDDDFGSADDEAVELGDGVFGRLGSSADQAATAAAVSGRTKQTDLPAPTITEEGAAFEDDDFDDFLLDLGLDASPATRSDEDDDEEEEEETPKENNGKLKPGRRRPTKMAGLLDDDDDDDDEDGDVDLGDLELLVGGDEGDIDDGPADLELDDPSVMATDIDSDIGLGLDDEDDLSDEGLATVPLNDDFEGETLDGEEDFFDSGFDYNDDEGYDAAGDMGDMW